MSDPYLNDLDFYSLNSMWQSYCETPAKGQAQRRALKKAYTDLPQDHRIELKVFKLKETLRKNARNKTKSPNREEPEGKNNHRDNITIEISPKLAVSLEFKPEIAPNNDRPLVKCYDLVPYKDPYTEYKIRSFQVFFYYDSYFFEQIDIHYFGNRIQINRNIEFVFLKHIQPHSFLKALPDSTYKVYPEDPPEQDKEEEFDVCLFLAAMISPFF